MVGADNRAVTCVADARQQSAAYRRGVHPTCVGSRFKKLTQTIASIAVGAASGVSSCWNHGHPAHARSQHPDTDATTLNERALVTRPHIANDPNAYLEFGAARVRPVLRSLVAQSPVPARNVDRLDEVPDSSWFTNRVVPAAGMALGACADDDEPRPPFTVLRAKQGGATHGLVVRDARSRRYVFKLDQLPTLQPEVTTASDVIVSRLYWAAGYNTPCNMVVYAGRDEFRIEPASSDRAAGTQPIDPARLRRFLALGTRRADGRVRIGASLFVPGEPIGPWSPTGTREDDPGETIPREDRRELRAERLLAAWVNHWDVRGANSLDAFEPAARGVGVVRHYMLDFGDSLGAFALDNRPPAQLGLRGAVDPAGTLIDRVSLGHVSRPWHVLRRDPQSPALGYFEAEHFVPSAWVPSRPSLRFQNATPADLGWMARRIARITPDHVRVAVANARFEDSAHGARLLAVLLARRERVLEWGFASSSPIADVTLRDGHRLCAVDLAARSGDATAYDVDLRRGEQRARLAIEPDTARPGGFCVTLPITVKSDAETVDVIRTAPGRSPTRLRIDLVHSGTNRDYVIANIER